MSLSLDAYRGKTVLVTGATGFTGQVVTRKLVEHGAIVRAIARPSSDITALADLDIEWHRGEVFDPDTVKSACESVEYIFHLAAAFREVKDNDEGYARVHVESTQLLVKEIENSSSFQCFVHVSTVGVHGHIEAERADENYRFAPGDGYQRTKLEGEEWVTSYCAEHNVPFSVVRPAPIFGPGDMRLLKLFRMVSKGYLLILGKGKCFYHLVHVDDLSNVILLCGITPAARSEIFIAAGDNYITLVDICNTIADKLEIKRPRVIKLPLFPFYLASDICEFICKPLGLQPPIHRRRVDFYTKDRKFTNEKSRHLLDYEYQYDNDRGLAETAAWYASKNLLK